MKEGLLGEEHASLTEAQTPASGQMGEGLPGSPGMGVLFSESI